MPRICQSDRSHKLGRKNLPLYRIVSKFTPIKLGSRNVSLVKSHVPSPTWSVFDAYELLPGEASVSGILVVSVEVPRNIVF